MATYDQWKLASPPYWEPPICAHCGEDFDLCTCGEEVGYTRADYEADRADTMHSDGKEG